MFTVDSPRTSQRYGSVAVALLATTLFLLAGCTQPIQSPSQSTKPVVSATTPSITVQDQTITNGAIKIAKVMSNGANWLVIQADQNGQPGPVLGYVAVKNGENDNLTIKVDADKATATLYAVLHKDAGKVGTFEFPGPDAAIMTAAKPLASSFKLTNMSANTAAANSTTANASSSTTAAPAAEAVTVMMREDKNLGPILTDAQGKTLYLFKNDTANKSTCTGDCAKNWMPFTVKDEDIQLKADTGVTGVLSTLKRDDGSYQVTYDQMPLYYYANDKQPGDVNGQGMNSVWYAVTPAGTTAIAKQ